MKVLLTSSLALGVVFMLGASSPAEAKIDGTKSSDSNIVQIKHKHHYRHRGGEYYYYYGNPYYYGPDRYYYYDNNPGLCVGPLCLF